MIQIPSYALFLVTLCANGSAPRRPGILVKTTCGLLCFVEGLTGPREAKR